METDWNGGYQGVRAGEMGTCCWLKRPNVQFSDDQVLGDGQQGNYS